MARTFIKLVDESTKTEYYLVWSSIVDAPVTKGMTKQELIEWIKEKYGSEGLKTVDFERLEELGTTNRFDKSAKETISFNRAGELESKISYKEIIKRYCLS